MLEGINRGPDRAEFLLPPECAANSAELEAKARDDADQFAHLFYPTQHDVTISADGTIIVEERERPGFQALADQFHARMMHRIDNATEISRQTGAKALRFMPNDIQPHSRRLKPPEENPNRPGIRNLVSRSTGNAALQISEEETASDGGVL